LPTSVESADSFAVNVHVAGALLAIGIALYIVGFRGLLGPSTARPGPRAAAERATMAAWLACACAAAASFLFAVVPVHVTETSSDAGVDRSHQTLVESEGFGVLPVLVAPVAITALAALTRRPALRTALAAVLDAACVLAMLSIGAFYVPAAIALTIAAARTPAPPASPRHDELTQSTAAPGARFRP
jgi:hypothetical protein